MEIKFETPEQQMWFYKAKEVALNRGVGLEQLICPWMLQEFADMHPKAMQAVINTEPDITNNKPRKEMAFTATRTRPNTWKDVCKKEMKQYGAFLKHYYRQNNGNQFVFHQHELKTLFFRSGGVKIPAHIIQYAKKRGGQHKKVDNYEYIVIDFKQMEAFWKEVKSDFITL